MQAAGSSEQQQQPESAPQMQVDDEFPSTRPKSSHDTESEPESDGESETESEAPPASNPTASAADPTASAAAPTEGVAGNAAGPQMAAGTSRKRRSLGDLRNEDRKAFRAALTALSGASGEAFGLSAAEFENTSKLFEKEMADCRRRSEKARRYSRLIGTDPEAEDNSETHARRSFTDGVRAFETVFSDHLSNFLQVFLPDMEIRQCPPLFHHLGKNLSVLFANEDLNSLNTKFSRMINRLVTEFAQTSEHTLKWRLKEGEITRIIEYVPYDQKALATLLDVHYAIRNCWSHGRTRKRRGVFVDKRKASIPMDIRGFRVHVSFSMI